jgi:hypothetical protein
MKAKTPIAVFVYNRFEHTARMLASLDGCYRLDECQVFIYSDAPRTPEHFPAVQAVRELSKKWALRHHAEVIERQQNLGVDLQVVSGVSELCQNFGRFIAIEDDLVLHPAFLHFMLNALDYYQDDERVALITGYIFPAKQESPFDLLFLPITSPWGWATWKRAWDMFDWEAPGAKVVLLDDNLRNRFDLNGAYPYSQLLFETLKKEKISRPWDILFYWAVFSNKKLSVYPAYSLVHNEGFDGSGVHFAEKWNGYHPLKSGKIDWPADHKFTRPPEVRVDDEALYNIESFLSSAHRPLSPALFSRLKRIYRKLMKEYISSPKNLRW